MMPRLVLLIVVAALVGGAFALPRPEETRLAATQAGHLLRAPAVPLADAAPPAAEDVGPRMADGGLETDGSERPLWRVLTEGAAAHVDDDGAVELWVRGYRMDLSRAEWRDHRLHARMFESLKRSLRSIAAEEGLDLTIKEDFRNGFPGAVFLCSTDEDRLVLDTYLPDGTVVRSSEPWSVPGPLSAVPFLAVILVALLLRRPLLALGAGVVVGAVLERFVAGASVFGAMGLGLGRLVTRYLGGQATDPARLEMILFIVSMLAMVGLVTRAGGLSGLMRWVGRSVHSARRSQAATFLMGLVVFFDHYANAVLVGSTMRPLTDRLKVSREKLAYLVDSTAAPVAGLSIFSTWIAFEVSTFSIQLPDVGLPASDGYAVFLRTLPYRFYSLLTLLLVGLVVATGRDFGPMARAERRARDGEVLRPGSRLLAASDDSGDVASDPSGPIRARARTAIVPLATMIVAALAVILWRGDLAANGLRQAFFEGLGTTALLLGTLSGLAAALVLSWTAGLRSGIPRAAWSGVRAAATPLCLLVFAWMIGAICYDMGTTAYLAVALQETFNPLLLPIILFLLAGFLAFATGSSWSTMTILLPLVVGLAYESGLSTPIGGEGMLVVAIASVLEGAIFGDHCSPISHTTVMSSIAASCEHADHVKTQAPYAVLAMVAATLCGYCPAVVFGLSPLVSWLIGGTVLAAVFLFYGKRSSPTAVSVLEPDSGHDLGRAA